MTSDGVAQLVERQTRELMDCMTRVQTLSGAQEKLEFFQVKNVMLTHCQCAQPLCV